MKNLRQLSLILGFVGLIVFVLLGTMEPAAAAVCGPGSHWVDTCPSGTDSFPSVAMILVDIDFDGIPDIRAVLSGPTIIFRGNPIDTPDPLDPGHFNQINTELVDMYLTGGPLKLFAGDTIGNLVNDGPLYSPGALVEKPFNPALADSFFDVFFQVLTPFGLLHNNDPLRVTAVIDRVLPGNIPYIYQGPPILLYDGYDEPRAQLIHGVHIPDPQPCTIFLPYMGEDIPSGGLSTIQWKSHPEAVKYNVSYSINNGLRWIPIDEPIPYYPPFAYLNWHVSSPQNNKMKCLVKVRGYSASGMTICEDTSDKFTIEVVKVTSPDGGEILKSGETHTITWRTNATADPVAKVYLSYTDNGERTWRAITTLNSNTGSYAWSVPYVGAKKKKCEVKVVLKDASGKTVGSDKSDGYFRIKNVPLP